MPTFGHSSSALAQQIPFPQGSLIPCPDASGIPDSLTDRKLERTRDLQTDGRTDGRTRQKSRQLEMPEWNSERKTSTDVTVRIILEAANPRVSTLDCWQVTAIARYRHEYDDDHDGDVKHQFPVDEAPLNFP